MIKAKIVLSTLFAFACSSALALDCVPEGLGLSAKDFSRLSQISTTRTKGLAAAMLGENLDERREVAKLYGMGIGAPKVVPTGNYKCRTIKMGGLSELIAYKFFDCRISQHGEDLLIEKLTGSQRFTGKIVAQETGYAYRGAGHYGYEAPRKYGADEMRNQVGCFYDPFGKPTSIILELPSPQFESLHDVIELVQQY